MRCFVIAIVKYNNVKPLMFDAAEWVTKGVYVYKSCCNKSENDGGDLIPFLCRYLAKFRSTFCQSLCTFATQWCQNVL